MTTNHKILVSPFLGEYLVLRPGSPGGLKISEGKYRELTEATSSPEWLTAAAAQLWNDDISTSPFTETALVRPETPYGFVRATYELNLGCNYDCEHCYLGLKEFSGLAWPEREKLLYILRDAGVLWLQLTGGEPMIDKLFPEVYG